MSLHQYINCSPIGDTSTAIKEVVQEITDLISDIDASFDANQLIFDDVKLASDDLLLAIDELLSVSDTPELRGIDTIVDTLCLLPVNSSRTDEEKRLSLFGIAMINGVALIQDDGSSIDEIRKLVNIVGIDEAKNIISSSSSGDKIVLITKPYQMTIGLENRKFPSVDYINYTYGLNVKDTDVLYMLNEKVVDSSLIIPDSENAKTVINLEKYIGCNISIDTACNIENVSQDKLNIYVFIIGGKKTSSGGKAIFTTSGFNSKGFSNNNYNITLKINNSLEYTIDVTGNNGSSTDYDPATIASTINWNIPDISVQAIGGELIFKTNKVGATSSIEFINSNEYDCSYTCGIVNGLKNLYNDLKNVDNSNIKVSNIPDIEYTSGFSGVNATNNVETPLKISDLPKMVIKGGNDVSVSNILRNDILRFKAYGFSNEQINAISLGESLSDVSTDTVTDNISNVQDTFNNILSILSDVNSSYSKNQVIDSMNRVIKLSNSAILEFDSARSSNSFQVVTISNPDIFDYLYNYVGFTDEEIRSLFYDRDDIHSIDTLSTDEDIINKVNEASTVLPGSTALSTNCLNNTYDSSGQNKFLFNKMSSQLNSFKDSISIDKILQINDISVLYKTAYDAKLSASDVLDSVESFNSSFIYNLNQDTSYVDGFSSYDSPGSILMRTINPFKTFRIYNETNEIKNAASIFNTYGSGTYKLLSSISDIINISINHYSSLNSSIQSKIRLWSINSEVCAGVLANLNGNGYSSQALIKCAYSTPNIPLNIGNISKCIDKLDVLTDKFDTACTLISLEFNKITDQLLCKINSIIDKIDVSYTASKLFHCSAQLKVNFDPSLSSLIHKISVKLNSMSKLLKTCLSNYRYVSIGLKNQKSPLEDISSSIGNCESDTINKYFGEKGEITNLATDALSSFGSKFTPSSSILSKFSLPQPPKNLESLLSKVTISKPNVPKI